MGCPVVDPESRRPAPHVDAEGFPGEWRLEDALTQVSREEQGVWTVSRQCVQETKLGDIHILCFIHDDEIVGRGIAASELFSDRGQYHGRGKHAAVPKPLLRLFEDPPELKPLLFTEAGLPAQSGDVAILIPGRQVPGIHDISPDSCVRNRSENPWPPTSLEIEPSRDCIMATVAMRGVPKFLS